MLIFETLKGLFLTEYFLQDPPSSVYMMSEVTYFFFPNAMMIAIHHQTNHFYPIFHKQM